MIFLSDLIKRKQGWQYQYQSRVKFEEKKENIGQKHQKSLVKEKNGLKKSPTDMNLFSSKAIPQLTVCLSASPSVTLLGKWDLLSCY